MIPNMDEKVGWIERLVKVGPRLSKWVESWQYSGIFKLFLGWIVVLLFIATFLMTFFCYRAIKNGVTPSAKGLMIYQQASEEAAKTALEKDRQELAKKDNAIYALSNRVELAVNNLVENYRSKLDADRVAVTIFHDTEKMGTNLHFRFFSECYEHVNYDRGVEEIADLFQKKKTSLFPMFSYMSINKEFYGTPKDCKEIDVKYAHRLQENSCGWIGLYFLRTQSGKEIGVLTVSWLTKDLKYKPEEDVIKNLTRNTGQQLEALFDINNPSYHLSESYDEERVH